jgi:hypothetical protein
MITIPENELMIFSFAMDELFDGECFTVEGLKNSSYDIDKLTCLLRIKREMGDYSLYHSPDWTILFVDDESGEVLSTSKTYIKTKNTRRFLQDFMSAVYKVD